MAEPPEPPERRALALWATIVVPIWLVLVVCVACEPLMFDSWALRYWHFSHPLSFDSAYAFAKTSHYYGNPRLGQLVSMLLFTPGPWHAIVTPIVELALVVLVTAFALGRWPTLGRRDALAFLTTTALVVATCPHVGPMLFYRPYTGNYLYPGVLDLLVLLPFRLHLESPVRRGWWLVPVLLVLGVATGLCNEHTGPPIVGLMLAGVIVFRRRGERIAAWMIAAAVGVAVGYALLILAPGQSVRYQGLADKQSLVELIASRGVLGNAQIIGQWPLHMLATLPWVIVALIARRKTGRVALPATVRTSGIGLVGAALLACLLLYGAPKVGERLYLASTVLSAAAIAAWVIRQASGLAYERARVLLSAALLVFVGAECLAANWRLKPASDARQAAIEDAPRGSKLVVAPYPLGLTYWNLGDDFEQLPHRRSVAQKYGLAGIELAR